MTKRKKADDGAVVGQIEKILECITPADLICLLEEIDAGRRGWKPGCNKIREFTYHHVEPVDKCPQNENQEVTIETAAQTKAEDKVRRLCRRNARCKKLTIIDTYLSGSGCNCGNVPIKGKVCVYTCTWTVKYKCETEAEGEGSGGSGSSGGQEF